MDDKKTGTKITSFFRAKELFRKELVKNGLLGRDEYLSDNAWMTLSWSILSNEPGPISDQLNP